jgi:hypothetical protein
MVKNAKILIFVEICGNMMYNTAVLEMLRGEKPRRNGFEN